MNLLARFRRFWPWLGLLIGILGAFSTSFAASPITAVRRRFFDQLKLRSRAPEQIDTLDSPIVLVGIDQDAHQLYGNVIPRDVLAQAIDRLTAEGAKVIALDLTFQNPDLAGARLGKVLQDLEPKVKDAAARQAIHDAESAQDPDSRLAAALSGRPVTAVFYGNIDEDVGSNGAPSDLPESWRIDSRNCTRVRQPKSLQMNIAKVRDATRWGGNALMRPDGDGLLRRYPLMAHVGDCESCVYPSLALSAASQFLDATLYAECAQDTFSYLSLANDERTEDRFPMDADSGVEIDYRGGFRETFGAIVPFGDLMAGKYPPKRFDGKLVIVGYETPYDDLVATPQGRFNGFGIHALVAHSILSGHWVRRTEGILLAEPIAIVLLGLLVTLLFLAVESPTVAFLLAPILPFAGLGVSHLFLKRYGLLVDGFYPGIVGFVAILACVGARFFLEREKRQQTERELGRFLSPEVVNIALKQPALLLPARREISILFSDIRGFTTTAEGMTPEALVSLLDGYLTRMTDIVFANRGTLDKYIGDAVMALFGAPVGFPGHAEAACLAALSMFEALEKMQADWKAKGQPVLKIGIGINTGMVSVGRMGSSAKSEYTCIGDEVNFASRIEGLTKVYGVKILVGENTRAQVGEKMVFRSLGKVKVKGKKIGVGIHELVGTRAAAAEAGWAADFERGMTAFHLRDWPAAEAAFRKVIAARGEDAPSSAFLGWIGEFRAAPPPADWDGSIERAEK
jgi:adenylate cyclase